MSVGWRFILISPLFLPRLYHISNAIYIISSIFVQQNQAPRSLQLWPFNNVEVLDSARVQGISDSRFHFVVSRSQLATAVACCDACHGVPTFELLFQGSSFYYFFFFVIAIYGHCHFSSLSLVPSPVLSCPIPTFLFYISCWACVYARCCLLLGHCPYSVSSDQKKKYQCILRDVFASPTVQSNVYVTLL